MVALFLLGYNIPGHLLMAGYVWVAAGGSVAGIILFHGIYFFFLYSSFSFCSSRSSAGGNLHAAAAASYFPYSLC